MENKDNYGTKRLQELSGSDFEIVDGQPDIRGWDVKDNSGKTIGEVDELIFDVSSRKVRYMVVDLDNSLLDVKSKHVLVPIGLAQLHEKDDDVLVQNVTTAQLASLPEYNKGDITSDTESSIKNIFGGVGAGVVGSAVAGTGNTEDFYNHDHFNDDNLYKNRRGGEGATKIPIIEENLEVGKREVETGGVRLRSRITETPVQETISLKEEKVTVERKSVDRPVSQKDLDQMQGTEIELRESAEVPVVNKQARVVEEINVSKNVTQHDETIRDTVRKTDVEIDRLDNDKLSGSTRNDG